MAGPGNLRPWGRRVSTGAFHWLVAVGRLWKIGLGRGQLGEKAGRAGGSGTLRQLHFFIRVSHRHLKGNISQPELVTSTTFLLGSVSWLLKNPPPSTSQKLGSSLSHPALCNISLPARQHVFAKFTFSVFLKPTSPFQPALFAPS